MVRTILLYGNGTLNTYCTDADLHSDETREIVLDLLQTMNFYRRKAIGLAANQIGYTKRIIAVTNIDTGEIDIWINPFITELSAETEKEHEGCMSYPKKLVKVKRPKEITVVGWDIGGTFKELTCSGLQARIFCHEIDHLNGKCIVAK